MSRWSCNLLGEKHGKTWFSAHEHNKRASGKNIFLWASSDPVQFSWASHWAVCVSLIYCHRSTYSSSLWWRAATRCSHIRLKFQLSPDIILTYFRFYNFVLWPTHLMKYLQLLSMRKSIRITMCWRSPNFPPIYGYATFIDFGYF